MIPDRENALWERPFAVAQAAMDRFMTETGRLPGAVQLAIYPLAVIVATLHLPIALIHFLLSLALDRFNSCELPNPTRVELIAWMREAHKSWTMRHESLRKCNPVDVADNIALPVIVALRDAIDAIDRDDIDPDRVRRAAAQLRTLPSATAPDAKAIGLCLEQWTASETVRR
jgi:hypothetical protein